MHQKKRFDSKWRKISVLNDQGSIISEYSLTNLGLLKNTIGRQKNRRLRPLQSAISEKVDNSYQSPSSPSSQIVDEDVSVDNSIKGVNTSDRLSNLKPIEEHFESCIPSDHSSEDNTFDLDIFNKHFCGDAIDNIFDDNLALTFPGDILFGSYEDVDSHLTLF